MRSRKIVSLMAALGLAMCTMAVRAEENKDEKEGNEVQVKFTELPAPVQATLNKESGGAKIDTVDKETDEGKTIYEADAKIDGQNYEIKVADDGKLISKKADNEEDEKGEKDKQK